MSRLVEPALRDPAARRRLGVAVVALVLLGPLLWLAGMRPGGALSGAVLVPVPADPVPAVLSSDFLHALARASLDTLAMACAGMAAACALAVPLAMASRRPPEAAVPARGGLGRGARFGRWLARGLISGLGAVPELVWALLAMQVLPPGPVAGALALAIAHGGPLAKAVSGIPASIDARRGLASGFARRWEAAVHAAVVIGFVGAGGLGGLMGRVFGAPTVGHGGVIAMVAEVAAVAMAGFALAKLAGLLGTGVRAVVIRVLAPGAEGVRLVCASPGPGRVAGLAGPGGVLAAVLASSLWLAVVSPVVPAVPAVPAFPGFGSADFPCLVGIAALQTFAVSVLGTLTALVGAALLALPAAGRVGRGPGLAVRLVLDWLGSVPAPAWVASAVLAAGQGPAVATLGIALHATGVLGRRFSEVLGKAPSAPEAALRDLGAGVTTRFVFGALPLVASRWLALALRLWQANVRMAAGLGLVGGGGLGILLREGLATRQPSHSAAALLATAGLALAVDAVSRLCRGALRLHRISPAGV